MSPSIIILGAGASGLSAALRLFDSGFKNVKILEAEDRIGGRIYTKSFGDGVIDLGAQFCREDSIVSDLISGLDLVQQGMFDREVYHSKHNRLSDNFLKTLFERILILHKEKKPENVSLKQYLSDKFNSTLVDYFESDGDKALAKDSINFVEKSFILITGAFYLDEISGAQSKEYPPDFKLVWKNGYQSFLDVLIKNYLEPKALTAINNIITLKTEVKTIEWGDQTNTVRLTCSDGTTHTADHVIITMSLGALKKQHSSLFSPALPAKKRQAIELLGFGSLLKIAYYFPEKWWGNNNIMLAWSEDDLNQVDFKQGPSKNGQSWVTNFSGFYIVPNNPNILMAWYIGNLIPEVELCSDNILLDGAYYVLKKFVGSTYKNITKPTKVTLNNWFNNPHFGGVLAYPSVESKKFNITGEDLAEPILVDDKPKLLFAGEATSKDIFGSVNGAVLSGFREADRIIQIYKPVK